MNEINLADLAKMQSALSGLEQTFQNLDSQTERLAENMTILPDVAQNLESVFERAGGRISRALGEAARSGEVDFQQMSEAILADLARIATEAIIARGAAAQNASQTVNFNMSLGAGSDASSIIGAAGSIATLLAGAVARGGRFL